MNEQQHRAVLRNGGMKELDAEPTITELEIAIKVGSFPDITMHAITPGILKRGEDALLPLLY